MCGIVGYVGAGQPEVLTRMVGALLHRGPDGRDSASIDDVHLGHTRLAIIDREGGAQPMSSADGSLIIVFNGEIYDHDRVRADLESAGHRFRTRSDTEVLLECYRAHGADCVQQLNGMFAFVIYDRARRMLFGARDRFGKKPLYITRSPIAHEQGPVEFAFASEVTSLCHHPAIKSKARVSTDGLLSYLLFDGIVAPSSIREGVRSIEPGEAFTFGLAGSEAPGLRSWRYWEPTRRGAGSESISVDEAGDRIVELLGRAVERRLVADVPVGLFLSGGVDSSAVLGLMARQRPAGSIHSFSIGFDDPSFDESRHAQAVAREVGCQHRHRVVTSAEMVASLDMLLSRLDEPLADPSLLPTWILSAFCRDEVTVALSGEGGDELFAGYDPFRALAPARWYRRLVPRACHRNIVWPLARLIPRSEGNMSLDFKVHRFLRGLDVPVERQLSTWLGSFSLDQLRRLAPDLVHGRSDDEIYRPVSDAYHSAGESDIDRALDYFQRFYLPGDILRKVDRASMLVGLEVRCPFLDRDLVDFVQTLPASWKYRAGVSKWILKEGLRRHRLVPTPIIHRPKKGFGIPIARWIRGELRDEVEEALLDAWPTPLDMFDPSAIERLLEEHLSGQWNRAKEVWSLFVLSRWARHHLHRA